MKRAPMKLDWKKGNGLVPAIIVHAKTGKVLMLGTMDKQALKKTLTSGKVWFYSRTKRRLWMKGETSGHVLALVDVKVDCDSDALLVSVSPSGPTCHQGTESCFGENGSSLSVLGELFEVIADRKRKKPKGSYTSFLFDRGIKKICEKVAEESGEVIQAAKKETRKRLTEETVDLIYHLFVLLAYKNIKLEEVLQEAARRQK